MAEAAEGVARVTSVPVSKQEVAAAPTGPSGNITLVGSFDLTNPRAVRIAAEIAARAVTQITPSTMEAIRDIILQAQLQGLDTRAQARQIERILRQTAGLDAPRARALLNLERGLREQGLRDSLIRERLLAAEMRMLADRARTIARQETMMAANAGQVELWDQAEESGLMPIGLLREWITTPDDRTCPICRPMDGQVRPRGGTFVSPFDGSTSVHPPQHVLCRCSLALVDPVEEAAEAGDPDSAAAIIAEGAAIRIAREAEFAERAAERARLAAIQ